MLTDRECRNAQPGPKVKKLTDRNGLYLRIMVNGSKLFQWKYHFGGKEKTFSIGPYPKISLAAAREARDAAERKLKAGIDPTLERRLTRLQQVNEGALTFTSVAEDWLKSNTPRWSGHHAKDIRNSLEKYVFPKIGALPISQITSRDVLVHVIRPMEESGALELSRRVRTRISGVFQQADVLNAVPEGYNPAGPKLLVAMTPPKPVVHQPSLKTIAEVRGVLSQLDRLPAHPVTRLAMRFVALTAVRGGTLRLARWEQMLNLDSVDAQWHIPAHQMKGQQSKRREFTVPLCSQAVDTLAAMRTVSGHLPLVFPGERHAHRPITENSLLYLLYRAGFKGRHTVHGWRSTFSTVMNELHPQEARVIDFALAHHVQGVEGAYNHAQHLNRRRELHQEFADLLMVGLPSPTELLSLPSKFA